MHFCLPLVNLTHLVVWVLFFVLSYPTQIKLQAQTNEIVAEITQTPASVAKAMQAFDAHKYIQPAIWGYHVQEVETGITIAAHQAEKVLTPASSLKAITTATALQLLGSNYTFTTLLNYDGHIDTAGVLHGNLYIVGGGDPTLGTSRKNIGKGMTQVMAEWLNAVQQMGIKKIEGQIIGDGRYFEEELSSPKWLWEDIGNYYGAGTSGLSFKENSYAIVLESPNTTGEFTRIVDVIPELPQVRFVNHAIAGQTGSGDQAYIFGSPLTEEFHVRGTIPPGKKRFYVRGAVPEPPLFVANLLEKKIEGAGIPISGGATTMRRLHMQNQVPEAKQKTIYTIQSPPLHDIVRLANKKSVNLYTDHLLKALGKKQYGEGSRLLGINAIENYWKAKGVELTAFQIHDGSGLSPINKVSAAQFTNILATMYNLEGYNSFFESLPIAGNSSDIGTMKYFLGKTRTANNMRAKSGTMGQVKSYVGYVRTRSNKMLAFAIIVNNFDASYSSIRRQIELLLKPLADLP